MEDEDLAQLLAEHVTDRSARGIATTIGRLVRTGELAIGARLPTVRELATALGISPTTVSEAWQSLARTGAIDARGRNGTFVRDVRRPRGSARYRSVTARPSRFGIDLSTGVPDPDLLPDPRKALERVSRRNITSSYVDLPVLPTLSDLLRERWPFEPEALTVVDGAMDAIDRVLATVVKIGDCVVVEDPGFPPILDLLEELGATPIGVPVDQEGMEPEAFLTALAHKPAAVILQPRAHNPTGTSTTPARAKQLASLLAQSETLVIEDDHSGDIAWAPNVSIGQYLPERCVHIQSFSKSHGPDLRLAAVGGTGRVVDQLVERRMLGPGWSSRLLQAVLVEMLRDQQTVDTVARARLAYRDRRFHMVELLASHGVHTTADDGINLWLAVHDEKEALLTLASHGIGAAPGTPFWVDPSAHNDSQHIRVTVGLVTDEAEEVASAFADAVLPFQPYISR